MNDDVVVIVSLAVSAAVPALSVQCADLQTAAEQAEQGAGRSCHVSRSGTVPDVYLLVMCSIVLLYVWCVITAQVVLQVGHCYLQHLSSFPQELSELLMSHHTVLDPDLRMVRASVNTTQHNSFFFIFIKCEVYFFLLLL